MSATFPLDGLDGYTSQTLVFKNSPNGPIHADVLHPKNSDGSPVPVLIHYHGGFLIVGDRYSFLPHWLVNACASRGWIFVSPEYRLVPETTAHSAVDDAVDAYEWVCSSLPAVLGRPISRVMVSGSSAGGYLALTTTAIVKTKPAAALLVYGMLDPAGPRYTSPGPNIFGKPAIDAEAILREHPLAHGKGETRQVLSAVTVSDPAVEKRFAIAEALHLKGLFVDYLTGVSGLGQVIREHGVGAIPNEHARLFPLSSGDLSSFPRTMLLHGKNDSAVPAENSTVAAEKLRSAGVSVLAEFPEDAEHGFDVRPGNINVEASDASDITAADALRKAIRFLDDSVKNS